ADKLILHGAFAEYSEWSYLAVDNRWHTVVADNGGAGDGTVDLVGVEQLQDSTGKLVNIVAGLSPQPVAMIGANTTLLGQYMASAFAAPGADEAATSVVPPSQTSQPLVLALPHM